MKKNITVMPLCLVENLHIRTNPKLMVAGTPDNTKPRMVFSVDENSEGTPDDKRDAVRSAYAKQMGINRNNVRACAIGKYDNKVPSWV